MATRVYKAEAPTKEAQAEHKPRQHHNEVWTNI